MSPAEQPLLLWRLGDALLALPVSEVVRIGRVNAAGHVDLDGQTLEAGRLGGLPSAQPGEQAVVVRRADGPAALPSSEVHGVVDAGGPVEEAPAWIRALGTRHIHGILRLADGRVAALLNVEGLPGPAGPP